MLIRRLGRLYYLLLGKLAPLFVLTELALKEFGLPLQVGLLLYRVFAHLGSWPPPLQPTARGGGRGWIGYDGDV